jgi:hypothetical protein
MDSNEKSQSELIVPKKSYVPPQLIEYGSVAKLTETTNASIRSDSGNNHMHT